MKNQIKKNLLDKNLEIEMLEKQLADWKLFNDQLQESLRKQDTQIKDLIQTNQDFSIDYKRLYSESNRWQDYCGNIKNMNLFQLILWWFKKWLHPSIMTMRTGVVPK